MIKVYVIALLILVLTGCEKHEGAINSSIISQNEHGGDILVACASGRIEIGIKSKSKSFSEEASMLPLRDMRFASRVRVMGKESGRTIINSTSIHPVVYWMDNDGDIEYVGLHEIEVESAGECHDYLISLHFKSVPVKLISDKSKTFVIYARRSMRP
jgi:hypothetical protein